MTVLRTVVRYGYAPFMMFGMTGAAYWVVSELVVAGQYVGLSLARAATGARLRNRIRERRGSRRSSTNGTITMRTATADQLPAHLRLRDVEHQWRAADPGDLLAVSVPGHLADAVADVGAGADRVRGRRLRLHDDALPQPSLCAAVAAACGASRRRPPLRHERRACAIRCIRSST